MNDFVIESRASTIFGRRVVRSYEIEEYGFIETTDDKTTAFHIYINGRGIGYHANSPDVALITAIAHKHDGPNSQAAYYMCKMIGLPTE